MVDTGEDESWQLKDLRKTCATYYDEHVPESSIEILGHSIGGITCRHYAHRAPLAFKAIMTLPQRSRPSSEDMTASAPAADDRLPMTKAEASEKMNELQEKTDRGGPAPSARKSPPGNED
ncbi:MAG: hypothetical protein KY475_03860 [Planctomycetes bacterium]|nr:hypothetical protein [Planctomycetota bacterium]